MQQFGVSQHIPDYVDTDDKLYIISYAKRDENCLVIHESYLDIWYAKMDSVF
jgi:hypothetical protein